MKVYLTAYSHTPLPAESVLQNEHTMQTCPFKSRHLSVNELCLSNLYCISNDKNYAFVEHVDGKTLKCSWVKPHIVKQSARFSSIHPV